MPKVRSKGVADGHPVNIPEPLEGSEGGTQRNSRVRGWLSGFKAVRGPGRQIHQVGSQPPLKAEYDGLRPYKVGDLCCQENPLRAKSFKRPYRKPTQVDEVSIHRRLREHSLRNSAN